MCVRLGILEVFHVYPSNVQRRYGISLIRPTRNGYGISLIAISFRLKLPAKTNAQPLHSSYFMNGLIISH